jgi:hypothetical protein
MCHVISCDISAFVFMPLNPLLPSFSSLPDFRPSLVELRLASVDELIKLRFIFKETVCFYREALNGVCGRTCNTFNVWRIRAYYLR